MPSVQDLPITYYGVIGAFFGTLLSNIISAIGASILYFICLAIFIFHIFKTESINVKNKFSSIKINL